MRSKVSAYLRARARRAPDGRVELDERVDRHELDAGPLAHLRAGTSAKRGSTAPFGATGRGCGPGSRGAGRSHRGGRSRPPRCRRRPSPPMPRGRPRSRARRGRPRRAASRPSTAFRPPPRGRSGSGEPRSRSAGRRRARRARLARSGHRGRPRSSSPRQDLGTRTGSPRPPSAVGRKPGRRSACCRESSGSAVVTSTPRSRHSHELSRRAAVGDDRVHAFRRYERQEGASLPLRLVEHPGRRARRRPPSPA